MERCLTPYCALSDGHRGHCRPTRHVEWCGAWMPKAATFCARRPGHGSAGLRRTGHRSIDSLQYDRDAARAAL
jgi:hypothetical protein